MNLDDAYAAITAALERMNGLYGQPVFDELVLVSIKPDRRAVLAYSGPRAESYKAQFAADLQPLRNEIAGGRMDVGDFVFAPAAPGTQHDVVMRLGAVNYLICNNTKQSMQDIRRKPTWLQAQEPFVALSEKFRASPLE